VHLLVPTERCPDGCLRLFAVSDSSAPTRAVRVPNENRFVVEEGGYVGELVYEKHGSRLTLVHTGVPEEIGGRGVGGRLVRAALEWAESEGSVVVPVCPYARKWLRDHPDEASAVTVDWSTRSPNSAEPSSGQEGSRT
jgi:predicted GNAT family acetyltransferase